MKSTTLHKLRAAAAFIAGLGAIGHRHPPKCNSAWCFQIA